MAGSSVCSRMWDKFQWRLDNELLRQGLAELIGTFILIAFGDGVVAQVVLSRQTNGVYLSISLCWGLGVMLAIYVCGGVSGGHINPAMSLANCLLGSITPVQCVVYSAAQYLGAFLGAAAVYTNYYEAMNAYDGGVRQVTGVNGTAGIFATYPQDYLSASNAFFDQILGTALLAMCAMGITDPKNMAVPKGLQPFLVGTLVMAIGMAYGTNCGYAINPARDFSPRLFTLMAGWGGETFSINNYNYFWIPVVGPYLGAIFGFLMYQFLVGRHWPDDKPLVAREDQHSAEVERLKSDVNTSGRQTSTEYLTDSNITTKI